MNAETTYWNNIRQTANEQEEALHPPGTEYDREGIVSYILSDWEITEEELGERTRTQYANDIADALEEF